MFTLVFDQTNNLAYFVIATVTKKQKAHNVFDQTNALAYFVTRLETWKESFRIDTRQGKKNIAERFKKMILKIVSFEAIIIFRQNLKCRRNIGKNDTMKNDTHFVNYKETMIIC